MMRDCEWFDSSNLKQLNVNIPFLSRPSFYRLVLLISIQKIAFKRSLMYNATQNVAVP
jgi:hypothetical protein